MVLTNCCLVDLIHVTLACEDANSELVEVVTVADYDAEDHVGNSLLQIWELMFVIRLNFCSDFEHKFWSRFCGSSSGEILKRKVCQYFAADFWLRLRS